MTTVNGSARPATRVTGVLDSVLGDLDEGGRAAPRPNPEVVARAKRRRYTAEYKQRILAQADAAKGSGEIGAMLRRNGLYSSHLVKWRREREAGILEGLAPQKRGPKVKVDARAVEFQKLQRENERLADQLRKAEIVIDVQKKVAMLLGLPVAETEGS
jgi:transposase-like protein